MESLNCEVETWVKILVPVLSISVLLLEAWLGKTSKTKSGSVLELIVTKLVWLYRLLKTPKS